ncbi:hypothetical protein ATN84_03335 [Paramesorhizobium deserti]|uniref:Transporter n=1 Tax=Paramesorhizobium deserti TaxID=1494590 RepID=A0A135I046_9HYPH|nr:hypothetical protein [Paramesorhizobium deserti]KXF78812.1 hypothetical protein ATN84_03335 [Paramesorhizobium deserti]
MPTLDDIHRYLYGSWRMMRGRPDGLIHLDISAEGFWQSFYAMVVAIPPLFAGWVAYAADLARGDDEAALRLSIVIRTAMVDMISWVLPIVAIGLLARRIGISRRFAPYVIASNWGTALIAWLFVPATLLRLFFPAPQEIMALVSIILFGLSIVFSYRLTQVALQRPHTFALPFYVVLFIGSIFITLMLQHLLGIDYPGPSDSTLLRR